MPYIASYMKAKDKIILMIRKIGAKKISINRF